MLSDTLRTLFFALLFVLLIMVTAIILGKARDGIIRLDEQVSICTEVVFSHDGEKCLIYKLK